MSLSKKKIDLLYFQTDIDDICYDCNARLILKQIRMNHRKQLYSPILRISLYSIVNDIVHNSLLRKHDF